MLGTLVQGRVSLDGAAVAASKLAPDDRHHATATSAASSTPRPPPTRKCCWTTRHQRRLFTAARHTYAADFAHEQLLQKFDDVFSGADDTDEDRQDLETLAAALKPLSTWHALTRCRNAARPAAAPAS